VQVDPIRPTLKPTRNTRLELNCDKLLSTSALKFNFRSCTKDMFSSENGTMVEYGRRWPLFIDPQAGAYTRPLFSST